MSPPPPHQGKHCIIVIFFIIIRITRIWYYQMRRRKVSAVHGSVDQWPQETYLMIGWLCLNGIGRENNSTYVRMSVRRTHFTNTVSNGPCSIWSYMIHNWTYCIKICVLGNYTALPSPKNNRINQKWWFLHNFHTSTCRKIRTICPVNFYIVHEMVGGGGSECILLPKKVADWSNVFWKATYL